MNIVAWLILGAVAGWVASVIMGTNGSQGLLGDIILGIIGAFLGGFLFNLTDAPGASGLNLWSLFVAVIGAIVALMIGRAISRTV